MQLLNVVYAITSASTSLSHCRYPLEVERSVAKRALALTPNTPEYSPNLNQEMDRTLALAI